SRSRLTCTRAKRARRILNSYFLILTCTRGAASAVDLAHHAPSRLQRALHPPGPRRGVLAGEMDAAFGRGQRLDESDLSGRVQGERAALPRIEPPAVRQTALAFRLQLLEDLRRLIARGGDAFLFAHLLERRRVGADRIRGERAA